MDAVTLAARISKATLYSRYANKAELFRAVVEDRLLPMGRGVSEERLDAGDSAGAATALLRRRSIEMGDHAGCSCVRCLARHGARGDHTSASQKHADSIIDLLSSDIASYSRAEKRPARDPRQVALDLMSLLTGWFPHSAAARHADVGQRLKFGDHAVDLLQTARILVGPRPS